MWANRLQTDAADKNTYGNKQLEKAGQRSQLVSVGSPDQALISKR